MKGTDVVGAVPNTTAGDDANPASDLIVIGAPQAPLLKNLLVGNVPEQIARGANVTVVMVKRRSSPLHSFLRQTVLPPGAAALEKKGK